MTDVAPEGFEPANHGLAWAVRDSFVAYIQGMPDGQIACAHGAGITSTSEFYFPLRDAVRDGDTTVLRFGGTVSFSAHHGMLAIGLDSLALHVQRDRAVMYSVVDDTSTAIVDAVLGVPEVDGDALMWVDVRTRLTAAGAALFGDTYPAGEAMASITLRIPAPRAA